MCSTRFETTALRVDVARIEAAKIVVSSVSALRVTDREAGSADHGYDRAPMRGVRFGVGRSAAGARESRRALHGRAVQHLAIRRGTTTAREVRSFTQCA